MTTGQNNDLTGLGKNYVCIYRFWVIVDIKKSKFLCNVLMITHTLG